MIDGLEQITEALIAGDKAAARRLLAPILQRSPTAEAWLLAARAMDDDAKMVICLKQALMLDPSNATAQGLLAHMPPGDSDQIIANNTPQRLLQYLDILPANAEAGQLQPQDADAEGVYEMLWDCQNCGTTKNLGRTHRFCPNCGTPQNPQWRYFPSDADKVRVDDHKFEGVDQVCASCGHLNGGAADFCGRCGAPQDNAQRAGKLDSREKGEGMPFGQQDLQTRLHREYDAAVGRVEPQSAGADKKPKGRRWLVFGLLAAAALACIALIFVFTRTEQKTVQVVDYRWEREINIEVLRAVTGSGSCGAEPAGAYNIQRRYEQVDTRRVPDGETCRNVQIDQGDGTFRQERQCQTNYRNEPVMGYVCYYTVNRWQSGRSVSASGDRGDPVVWPQFNLRSGNCVGCEREGNRAEDYVLVLQEPNSNNRYQCSVERSLWEDTREGRSFNLEINPIFNTPNCGSLSPA